MRTRTGGRVLICAMVGALLLPVAASADGGGARILCGLDGTATYDVPIVLEPRPFSYSFIGMLEDCTSDDAAAPSSGTIQAGGVYVVGEVAYRLTSPDGVGGCSTSQSSGVSVIDWADGSRTITSFATTSLTAVGILTGSVIEMLQVWPVEPGPALTLRTTRGHGGDTTGMFGFEADPSDCVSGGTTAGIRGFVAMRSGSLPMHAG